MRTFGWRLSTLTPPKVGVPALIAAAGAQNLKAVLRILAVNVRNPHTAGNRAGRQSDQHAVDENTGRRFRGWDISANVGVKLHAQVKDKMTRFMAEAAPHFAE